MKHEKVKKLDEIRKNSKLNFVIEIDGGINFENSKLLYANEFQSFVFLNLYNPTSNKITFYYWIRYKHYLIFIL